MINAKPLTILADPWLIENLADIISELSIVLPAIIPAVIWQLELVALGFIQATVAFPEFTYQRRKLREMLQRLRALRREAER